MDVDREADEIRDMCFLALTRPSMVLGVPLEACIVNGIATFVTAVNTGAFWLLGVGVAIHFVMRALVWEDHNRFRLLRAWIETRGIQLNRAYWGGSSVSPGRVVTTYSVGDIDHG
jgi:type IV secretion system protein VirB3